MSDGLQDRRGADVEEALELVDVVVEGGQRRARGPALVPAEVEVLDVVVGLDPQVVLDALGQAAPQHAGDVLAEADSTTQTTALMTASQPSWA